uniref:Uncharacterized protein n=1 Tax=Anguilla anguilla TaxID=7936 RepID=A0A0E9TDW2_ANGAN
MEYTRINLCGYYKEGELNDFRFYFNIIFKSS